jgi:hypothetical protein
MMDQVACTGWHASNRTGNDISTILSALLGLHSAPHWSGDTRTHSGLIWTLSSTATSETAASEHSSRLSLHATALLNVSWSCKANMGWGTLQDFTIDQAAGSAALVIGSIGALLTIIWQSKCHCKCNLCYLFQCERRPPPDGEQGGESEDEVGASDNETLIPPENP